MTIAKLVEQWRPIHRRWADAEPAEPASDSDLAALENLFVSSGADALPADVHELWSAMDGLGVGLFQVWPVQGMLNDEPKLAAGEHVVIGAMGAEYLGYHPKSGRIDFLDRLGDPRNGFPDLITMLEVIVNTEGG